MTQELNQNTNERINNRQTLVNDWFSDGAMVEYCITQPSSVACKSRRLTHVEAASVPIRALTAWQGLFDRAKLQPGEHVLVHGGAGAVRIFAIQMARFRGAHVDRYRVRTQC